MSENNTLLILTFEGVGTAATVYEQLEKMEKDQLLAIQDAIILERDDADAPESLSPAQAFPDKAGTAAKAPHSIEDSIRVKQTHGKKGKYTRRGGGLGLLAGVLLGGPVLGLAVGASIGAVSARLKDFGISDENITAIRRRLQPDSSGLLVLGHTADQEAFLAQLRPYSPQVVSSSLTPEVEAELRARLAE
ncbi:MAG: DUF1269 domain-containing protein [Ardenticatenaceae bacterium]|nr:DUF1269 domain-containing protein [Ardenticatenaceae bacterium]MCB8987580.1 DUF1269 domain-containing protein [Ardenticatenaceae bacterium]